MPDGILLNVGAGGKTVETVELTNGRQLESVQIVKNAAGVAVPISPLTDTELRAVPVPVSGTVATGGLTDAQLRASAVSVAGVVAVVSGPGLTDTELRATAVPVSGSFFQATQPVSAAALPLPAGASTEATLAAIKTKTDNLDVALSTRAVTGLTNAELRAADVPVSGTFFQATQPVSAAALPLPAGASTEATLAAIKAKTDNLDVALSTRAVTGLTDAQLRAAAVPVSGTFFQATQPVSAAALPLPAGASTDALQTAGNASLSSMDGKLPALVGGRIPVVLPAGGSGLTDTELRASPVPMSLASVPLPAGASTEATLALIKAKTDNLDVALSTRAVTGLTDAQLRAAAVPVSGTFFQATQPVSAAALPLPAGASTSALQTTGNTSLSSIDGKLPATLGQKAMAASAAVVIASDQSAVPVSGTFFQATQPVSAAALPLPAGASTSALQTTGNTSLSSIDGKLPATLGQKAMAASAAVVIASDQSAVPVSGTFFQATQPVSAAALPLPAGASTSALQTTGNTSLSSIDGKLPATLGQKAMAASAAVVIASDQSNVPVQVKDSGRVRCVFIFRAVAPAVADTLLTIIRSLDSTESSATTFAVTASKRLRITSINFSLRAGAAAIAFATMNLRTLKGPVLIGSPSILRLDLGNTGATIGAGDNVTLAIPDGLEFSGTDQIGISLAAQAVTNIISISLIGYEYTP